MSCNYSLQSTFEMLILFNSYYYTTPFHKYLARPDHHYLQIHDQLCAIFCLPYYTTMEQNILLRGIFIFKRDNELALRFYRSLIFCCLTLEVLKYWKVAWTIWYFMRFLFLSTSRQLGGSSETATDWIFWIFFKCDELVLHF